MQLWSTPGADTAALAPIIKVGAYDHDVIRNALSEAVKGLTREKAGVVTYYTGSLYALLYMSDPFDTPANGRKARALEDLFIHRTRISTELDFIRRAIRRQSDRRLSDEAVSDLEKLRKEREEYDEELATVQSACMSLNTLTDSRSPGESPCSFRERDLTEVPTLDSPHHSKS